LFKTLQALSVQSWSAASFEVLVVADSCEDDTDRVVSKYAARSPYRLRLLSHQARSAAATRNLGASQAGGDVLLFLDDDVVPRSGLVRAHIEAQHERGAVLGYSKPVLPARPDWFQYDARRWWEDTFTAFAQPDHRFSYRDFFSGNVSMAAELFREVSGFDLSFSGRLEDYELGLRLLKAGAGLRYSPAAVGDHYDSINLQKWLRRIQQEGAADVMMGQRHPELRYALFGAFERTGSRSRLLARTLAFAAPQRGNKVERLLLRQASLYEWLRMRRRWRRTINILREYRYWRGAAWAIGGKRALLAWLQEAPVVPAVAGDAPAIDLAAPFPESVLQAKLSAASQKGIRVLIDGYEVLALPPQAGAEPLRLEHLRGALRKLAGQQFIPALALHTCRSEEGPALC
jgi:glycosyltransferase involved in cell wall biosynthesis